MTFKDHFSGHAARYAQARPHYPAALFEWLAALAPAHNAAWDAGCGNGQAAVALAAHFDAVLATDPSAAQIANAEPHLRVHYGVEAAEACSAATASVALVNIAQALHWFEHERYYAQVRRVLEPAGVIAAYGYDLMQVAPQIDAIVRRLDAEIVRAYWPPERRHIDAHYADLPFPFDPVEAPEFVMRHEWTLAQVLAYLETWSAVQRSRKATGQDPLAAVARELALVWGDPEHARPVTWPLFVRVGRVAH